MVLKAPIERTKVHSEPEAITIGMQESWQQVVSHAMLLFKPFPFYSIKGISLCGSTLVIRALEVTNSSP
ncbi:hypothetical protein ACFX1Q_028433 [Malus domestica]